MKGRVFTVLIVIALLLTALVPFSSAFASNCTWHVVRRGQNLTTISRHYGVSVSAIVRANGIKNPSLIYVGQGLCIPKASTKPPASTCHRVYVVKRGVTAKEIAQKYGVTVNALVRANKLKNANKIFVGQVLIIPVRCSPPKPPKPTPPPAAKQWKGQYWTNRDLAGQPKFIRGVNGIDFNWGHGGPQDLGVVDNFSIRWTRTQYFEGGRYLFHVRTDDGIRLFVDGVPLIDQWHDNPGADFVAEKDLWSGYHTLKVDYYEGTGLALVKLQIERLGGGEGPTPPSGGSWQAKYWNNTTLEGEPVWTTTYQHLDFDWGRGTPKSGVTADYFSARYVGDFQFDGGTYRFYTMSDDGMRVWVDDLLIADEWRLQSRTTTSRDVEISKGTHRVKVEFFEWNGAAALKVLWTKK